MLLDRTHRSWAFLSAVILAVATASYVIYAQMSPRGPTGGSLMGLLYGIVGSLFMTFAGLLAGRKKVPFWRLGSAQFWLRGHLWLGTLSVPLILFHSGFGLGGVVEQLLWAFFGIVVLSGFFGLAMQHLLPRLLTSQVPRETFAAQIPYLRKRNRLLSDRLVSTLCGRLPVRNDPLQPQLERLAKFAAELQSKEKSAKGKAEKDEIRELKATWTTQVDDNDAGLFADIARFAKNSGWCRTENDFSTLLLDVYDLPGITRDATAEPPQSEKPDPAAKAQSVAGDRSPLEMMKARQAAAKSETVPAAASKPAGKSPLEMARAAGAGGGGKPARAVDQASASDEASAPAKKPSPLDMIRKQSSGTTTEASETAEAEPPESDSRKLSPLDMIRKQGGQAAKSTASLSAGEPASKPVVSKAAVGDAVSQDRVSSPKVVDVNSDADSETPAAIIEKPNPAGGDDSGSSRPASPLDQIRKASGATKPTSPLDQIRKASGAATPASPLDQIRKASSPAKPASPLDLIRKPKGDQTATDDHPAGKPEGQSPLELMKARAAAGKTTEGASPEKLAVTQPPAPRKAPTKRELLRTQELQQFYMQTVRPFLAGSGRDGRLADPTEMSRAFTQMRGTLPVELHETLATLQRHCEEHRQFCEQERIHHWLHYWLALHIPFSIGLFVLFVIHVVMSLRVVPWNFPFTL
ncbi:hypothetical protein GC176_25055 [bacterium]|nr:hypothetical protein [bacterium]